MFNITDLLFALKYIKKKKVTEVQRGDLVGQYVGGTEAKCTAKIKQSRGGVLFIDEAYRLTPRTESDYGRIVINQLMASMEKGDPVMIFAGYKMEMQQFLQVNPGLKSRIKYHFDFPDYSVNELGVIMRNQIIQNGYIYVGESIANILEANTTTKIRSEQNGRLIKNIVSEAIINLSSRLSLSSEGPSLITIVEEDLVKACTMFCESNTSVSVPEETKDTPDSVPEETEEPTD